jgi:hypothetical protein
MTRVEAPKSLGVVVYRPCWKGQKGSPKAFPPFVLVYLCTFLQISAHQCPMAAGRPSGARGRAFKSGQA